MTSPLIKEDISLFLNDKPSVYALREKAKTALLQTGFPTKKNEKWKYTNITPIINSDFSININDEPCGNDCCHHDVDKDSPFIEIHFCKGKLHIEEFNTPKGLSVIPLPLALYENEYKKYFFSAFNLEQHPFAALNGVYLEQGLCIVVDKDAKITKPLHIKYKQTSCNKEQINIHNLIILEKNSNLSLVEEFISEKPSEYLLNHVNEIYLKPNSSLAHYKIQKESFNAYHLSLNAIKQQQNSHYTQYYLSDGAKLSRQETSIDLEQTQAKTEIYSAYKARKSCLTDITTNINHLTEETFSNQYAKAVLEQDSTAVFQGKIHISPNAVKTDGHQLHKALYLDENATLYCKPELEIYADDVKCSHGASSGEIDKEQLFYLMSRGLDNKEATQILTEAHLEEILSYITNEDIRKLFFFAE